MSINVSLSYLHVATRATYIIEFYILALLLLITHFCFFYITNNEGPTGGRQNKSNGKFGSLSLA